MRKRKLHPVDSGLVTSFLESGINDFELLINAYMDTPNTSLYGATKDALLSLARTVSGELLPRGIRVNAISPGPIATPLCGRLGLSAGDLKATSEALQSQAPINRFGKPSKIESAVVFDALDQSAFTVGSESIVNGGLGLSQESQ